MMSNREIRQFAWRQLKGNWGAAVGASLLSTLCLMALVVLMAGGYVLAFFGAALTLQRTVGAANIRYVLPLAGVIMAALLFLLIFAAAGFSLGALRLNLRIARGERVRARDILAGFMDFRQLRHFACVYILLNLGSVLLSMPAEIVAAIYGGSSSNAHIATLVCNALAVVYAFYMSMSTLAAADDRNRSAIGSMRLSCHLMRCRKLRLLGLYLSFIPWVLLSMVSFGIGYLFTIPYLSVAQAIFFLSAYSEDYLTSPRETDYREVPEDNVGGSDAGAAAEAPGAPEMNKEAEATYAAEMPMSEQDTASMESAAATEPAPAAESASAEPPTLASETTAHEASAAEVNACGAPEEAKPEEKQTPPHRSFEEVYREMVLEGGNRTNTAGQEKGEE